MTGIRPERVPFGNEVATGSRTWFDDLRVDPVARATGANAADTYTGSVALLSVDAHVEFDRIGSRDEYVQ